MMIRSIFATIFALLIVSSAVIAVETPEKAASPAVEVEQATERYLEVLSDLMAEVPEGARSRIEKAIEVSRRGGEKALEALAKVDMSKVDFDLLMSGSQLRGLEKAIDAVEQAGKRAASKLEAAMDRVPEEASQMIQSALDRIGETQAVVMARLEGLLERGVSTARPPESPVRPDLARPSDVRPARPDLPTQVVKPVIPRPELPSRPDGRP